VHYDLLSLVRSGGGYAPRVLLRVRYWGQVALARRRTGYAGTLRNPGLCAEKVMVLLSGYAELVDEAPQCFGWDITALYVRLARVQSRLEKQRAAPGLRRYARLLASIADVDYS